MDMKIYCFMMRGDNGKFELYAYTPEKNIAKEFEETRNMDLFIKKTIEIDRSDYDEFYSKHDLCILDYHVFSRKDISDDNKYYAKPVMILCTTDESDNVIYNGEYIFSDYLYDNHVTEDASEISSDIFLPKYAWALHKFYVEDILYSTVPMDETMFAMCELAYEHDLKFDTMALFIYKYGKLFKKVGR